MKGKLGILLTVCAAVLAINLDTTIVNVALPTISESWTPAPASSSGSSTATTSPSPHSSWRWAASPTASAVGPR